MEWTRPLYEASKSRNDLVVAKNHSKKEGGPVEKISVLGIDLAKEVFQVHGNDSGGRCVLKKQLKRKELSEFIANLPTCLIGMEACGGANFWARKFQGFGHEVRLISPQFVKPYVKSNKNDVADAEAIAEAVVRPNMRFVSIKQVWQQDLQLLHRIRQRLVRKRVGLCNEMRSILHEYGIVLPKSSHHIRNQLPMILEDAENGLTLLIREALHDLFEELHSVVKQVNGYDKKLEQISRKNEMCQRIEKIEGVGKITSTAIVAAMGDVRSFENSRQFAAWLGLVPRQNSSGGKSKLLGISKRGDRYVRTLLVHGARSMLKTAKFKSDKRSVWAMRKVTERGFNRACVAIANKNARIIWALAAHNREYKVA